VLATNSDKLEREHDSFPFPPTGRERREEKKSWKEEKVLVVEKRMPFEYLSLAEKKPHLAFLCTQREGRERKIREDHKRKGPFFLFLQHQKEKATNLTEGRKRGKKGKIINPKKDGKPDSAR